MGLKQKIRRLDYNLDVATSPLKNQILKKKAAFSSFNFKCFCCHDKDQVQQVDDWLNKTDVNTDVSLKLSELKFKDNDLENMNLEIALNKNKANINLKEIVTIGGFENALIKFSNLAENLRLNHKKSKSEELDLSYEHSFSSVELKQKKKLVELTPYINNTKLEAIVLMIMLLKMYLNFL